MPPTKNLLFIYDLSIYKVKKTTYFPANLKLYDIPINSIINSSKKHVFSSQYT
jgi:hypothetical protein